MDELEILRKEHNELLSSSSLPPPSPSSPNHSAINLIREEHADEIQALIKSHAEALSFVQLGNTQEMDQLRATLQSAREEHDTALTSLQEARQEAMAELVSAHRKALEALQADSDLLISEMESSLAASEEDRRQMKLKVDQLHFELSRTKDEHQIQRSADFKHLEELEETKSHLEQTVVELEGIRLELSKRNSELEHRFSRRPSGILPPQGPPPNVPLPPLPAGLVRSPTAKTLTSSPSGESRGSLGSSLGGKQASHRRSDESVAASAGEGASVGVGSRRSIEDDVRGVLSELPDHLAGRVKKMVEERDEAMEERDTLRDQISHESKATRDLVSHAHSL